MRSVLLTGGTTAPANTQATGNSGPRAGGRGRGKTGGAGAGVHPDAFYLWVLVGLELVATVALRNWSRHHHGG